MNKEIILEQIKQQKPRLVYLSGKTCTGKTTFADFLEKHGYKKVELDKIVIDSVVIPFGVAEGDGFRTAYRGLGPAEQTSAFTHAANLEIRKNLEKSSLVIEGAVAQAGILREIFADDLRDFTFIYFHPIHADVYEKRILSRFIAGAKNNTSGLPKYFWTTVASSDLDEFKKTSEINVGISTAIKNYASKSMEESKNRLEQFRTSFPNIAVVEI